MFWKKKVAAIKLSLGSQPSWVVAAMAALVTFSVYTCMYGYRKAFTAASFSDQVFLGIHYKVWLVSAQVLGYMLSKFYGIRFIAESTHANRAASILKLILAAWLALLGFALAPAPWNIVFLFANGFPLGMIWGLVFSFVEGRRTTEFMGAVLASSFIFASGLAKTIGSWLIRQLHVQENWMPFLAGAIYLLPLLLFTWLLEAIPEPDEEDEAQRCVRLPMNHTQRTTFLRSFGPGLLALIATYVLLTILRDFRDNFAPEILQETNMGMPPVFFAGTETSVALLVLALVGSIMFIKNNYRAFYFNHVIVLASLLIAGVSTVLFSAALISAYHWYIWVGLGLYAGYIPINCLYFDRMIATFRVTANVGFVMYVADSFGYLGSVSVLFLKEFAGVRVSWLSFFTYCIYASCVMGLLFTTYALLYFKKKFHKSLPHFV